jgi:hypothetical protein
VGGRRAGRGMVSLGWSAADGRLGEMAVRRHGAIAGWLRVLRCAHRPAATHGWVWHLHSPGEKAVEGEDRGVFHRLEVVRQLFFAKSVIEKSSCGQKRRV